MDKPTNRVLAEGARKSSNFFRSDQILQHYLNKHLSDAGLNYMRDNLHELGKRAAREMDALSLRADQNAPSLKQRNALGEDINEVEFHPSYDQLLDIAAQSEMFHIKYRPELRDRFGRERHALGFAAGQLYGMGEIGVYCPLCMTDGAAHLVDKLAPEEDRNRLLANLSARTGEDLYTGAMFLTEKSGGSDVGRNLCTAEKIEGNRYKLNGEKWFCSNVNADVIMVLARTGTIGEGTRGLSLFLIEKEWPGGQHNSFHIKRLKEKLGVRSMATGEVIFNNTTGLRLGEEGAGFKRMTEMINISRAYNSSAAVAGSRRAIIEAYQYLCHRITFGKKAIEHALIRQKFWELGAQYVADFLLSWRAIRAMDAAEEGDHTEQQLMRLLIPMAKWRTAEQSVYSVRECMELMGGNGYIEDFVMPKVFRDVNVLPIWEGAGNIIVLDMLRAAQKSEGLSIIIEQIKSAAEQSDNYGELMHQQLHQLLSVWNRLEGLDERDQIEASAKPLFKQLIELYQMALMVEEKDGESAAWMNPSLSYMASTYDEGLNIEDPIGTQKLRNLIGWKY